MKVKSKIALGIGLLFIMIIILSIVGGKNINALKSDTENILSANYNTLEYSRNMLLVLDEEMNNNSTFKVFEDNLRLQENNITEPGEKEVTGLLAQHFEQLKLNSSDISIHKLIRKDISDIMKLNMQAIQRKSKVASETAHTAVFWIAITGTFCFILSFILLISMPGKIANPIKELDSAKTNFIATISHELKTPISTIKLSLQLLENEKIGKINPEQKNLVESIKDDANRLLKITGELLNMAQLESGKIQLAVISSEPKEILQYAINTNKIQADEKKIKFETTMPGTISKVLADSEKTTWVLTNLISNAIRYSYDNSVIYLSIEETENEIKFIVKDMGQGIAPKYKEKIFDRYFRVPGTQKEGTGLGLSISKEFIEAQGGSINVESDLGAGSTFTISLNKAKI